MSCVCYSNVNSSVNLEVSLDSFLASLVVHFLCIESFALLTSLLSSHFSTWSIPTPGFCYPMADSRWIWNYGAPILVSSRGSDTFSVHLVPCHIPLPTLIPLNSQRYNFWHGMLTAACLILWDADLMWTWVTSQSSCSISLTVRLRVREGLAELDINYTCSHEGKIGLASFWSKSPLHWICIILSKVTFEEDRHSFP